METRTADASVEEAPQTDGAMWSDAVETTLAMITFRFTNTGAQAVYLFSECTTPILVTSLSDGKTYGNGYACACDCANSACTGNMACGACMPPSALDLAPGATRDIHWYTRSTTMETKAGERGAFQCLRSFPIPTGSYKVGIGIYATESDAAAKANGHTVEKSFTLGTENAIIEVPVQ